MDAKVKRFACPEKGNGLRARGRIRGGELVYSAEPLACCVSNKQAREVCHHCLTRRETLLRCSQCKRARYCNTTCQRQAWPGHKRECKCLQSLLPRVPTDSVRLAARLIFALLSPSKRSSEELYTLEEHESHLTSMSEQKKQGLCHLASMLELYLQHEVTQEMMSALPPSCRDPLSLIAKVTCNCFTISDGELRQIGVGLYPSLSLLNHDCRPNCVMVFEGTKLQLRAVQDINPEEELTISYIDSLSATEDRRRQLEDQYHFTCHCHRCDSRDQDELMLSGGDSTWRPLKEAVPTTDLPEGMKAESDWQTSLERFRHLLSTVGCDVPDENLYKLRVTDMALDASIHLGLWEEALAYGEKTLPVYRLYYPDPHPAHGVQLMRVGKLQHYLEHVEDALDTFKQALEIMKFSHGDDHALTAELLMKMEECRCEMAQRSSRSH